VGPVGPRRRIASRSNLGGWVFDRLNGLICLLDDPSLWGLRVGRERNPEFRSGVGQVHEWEREGDAGVLRDDRLRLCRRTAGMPSGRMIARMDRDATEPGDTRFEGEPHNPLSDRSGYVHELLGGLSDSDLAEYCRYWTWHSNELRGEARGFGAWKSSM